MIPKIALSRECYACAKFCKECDGFSERESAGNVGYCGQFIQEKGKPPPTSAKYPSCYLDFIWAESPG